MNNLKNGWACKHAPRSPDELSISGQVVKIDIFLFGRISALVAHNKTDPVVDIFSR